MGQTLKFEIRFGKHDAIGEQAADRSINQSQNNCGNFIMLYRCQWQGDQSSKHRADKGGCPDIHQAVEIIQETDY